MPGPLPFPEKIKIYPTPKITQLKIDFDKLREIWLAITHVYWLNQHSGFDQARTLAAPDNRMLLVAFTGDTWCSHCKALKSEVFDTSNFGLWVFNHGLVCVHIDFPYDLAQADSTDAALFNQYQINGFPTVIGMNADGIERGRVEGYATGTGPSAWIAQFETETHMNMFSVVRRRIAKAA